MNIVINGDCIHEMAKLKRESVDLLIADPPYNTGNAEDKTPNYDQSESMIAQGWHAFHAEWDHIDDYMHFSWSWLKQARRLLKPTGSIFIFGSFHCIPQIATTLNNLDFYTIQWISWCIPNAFPHRAGQKMANSNQTIIWARKSQDVRHYYDHEEAKRINQGKNLRDYWINIDELPDTWVINNRGTRWKHPSKKPIEVIDRIIRIASKPGDLVLDPFGGSGTTSAAAQPLKRRSILVEKESSYIPMIRERTGATLVTLS